MEIKLMNVQKQHEEHAAEYESAALTVLRSGGYIGGDEVAKFESEFAEYEGARYGISCGSGTDALVLALRALGIGKGDEVITTTWTFYATAESIASVGATPVFVDVCEDTYCINPELIESVITDKTKAILPVHFYGQSADMGVLRKICDKHGLYLITDCAQSTGTRYLGERKNTLGDVSCFSFFPTKILGCDGDGGMVLTDSEEIAKACRSLKLHGSGQDGLWTLKREYEMKGEQLPEDMPIGESKYYNYLVGYNSRLDSIQAAILRRKLKYLDEFVDKRRLNAEYYNEALKNTEYGLPVEAENGYHSYYIYALRHPNASEIIKRLQEKGIQSGVYYPVPMHMQGVFSKYGYKPSDMPVGEELARTTFAIPVYPELTKEDKEYIVATLKEIL